MTAPTSPAPHDVDVYRRVKATELFLRRIVAFADYMAGEGYGLHNEQDEHGNALGLDDVCHQFIEATGGLEFGDMTTDEYISRMESAQRDRIAELEARVAELS